MLFKLSLKNIKKSLKDYAIYFFTLILGVSIFYVFNAMESQTVMLDVSSSTYEIIKLMNTMLSGVSVFVSIILGFLIIYASRFLMKRRKKEFAIYMTLGMGKGKISKILLFETLLIGVISLAVGLCLGIFISQFMSIIVANMFEANMDKFTFVLSTSSIIKTMIYFSIMYLLVMIFHTISVSKCKLIELLQASRVNEKIKMKKTWLSVLVFILASCILGVCYYSVTAVWASLEVNQLLLIIALGSISTYGIFWSLSGFILKVVMLSKKVYLKDLNMFVLRQISSKINTMVFSMTTICLMLFLTICILSSALSLKNSMTYNLKKLAPIDVMFQKNWDLEKRGNDNQVLIDDSKLPVRDTLLKLQIPIDEFKDIVEVNTYVEDNLTLRTTLGENIDETLKKFPFFQVDTLESIMRVSDYNKVATLYGLETFSLNSDEYLIIADFENMVMVRNDALKLGTTITINGIQLTPKYKKCQDGFVEISSNHINGGIIIVPDSVITEDMRYENYFLANYKKTSENEKKEIEDKITTLVKGEMRSQVSLDGTSKLAIYTASIGLGALVTFIGLYLGIIFLISSAAILALKELSESSDNKERYTVLRRIGVEEKMINKSLFTQIAIFFSFPLILAIIHSIFGMMLANNILITLGNQKLLASILMTGGILIVIYGGYFLITYYCSRNILKDE